jgi:four helix bundle protein
VASNYRAVCLAQTKAAFVAKVSTVLEEADESLFWLEFIVEERLVSEAQTKDLLKEADELTAIFYASRRTSGGKED